MTRRLLLSLTVVSFLGVLPLASMAQANNDPPPTGAILDLGGTETGTTAQTIDHGTAATESVDFDAAIADTDITFAFREDPAYISFSDVSLVNLTTGSSTNLILNGDFSSGSGNAATDWTYANVYGAAAAGVISDSCGGGLSTCWYDGAVQAYDAIEQEVATTVGDEYELSFEYSDNSSDPTFSDLSTNGDVAGSGGNGIDILAYAQAGLPPANTGVTPEPSTLVMLGTGMLSLAGFVRGRRRSMV